MTLPDAIFADLSTLELNRLAANFDAADEEGLLEAELEGGTLTITLPSGRQFVVSRHGPSKQMWLASPLSGGLHFNYDTDLQEWILKDGTKLSTLLKAEVETLLSEEEEEE